MKLKFFSVIPLIGIAASTALLTNEITTNHTQTNLINTSNHDLSVDTTTNYDEKWNASIKESSENTNIKLFFNRQATLPYQEAFLAAEYMVLDNINSFSTSGSSDDEILFFYNYDLYDSIDYWNVKNWDQKYGSMTNSGLKFICNTSKLGAEFSENYSQFPSTQIISDLLSYCEKTHTNSDYKFDVWIVDGALDDLWKNSIGTSDFYKFIQHINKIYVLSDGNWQTYYFINYCKERWETLNYVQLTEQEIEQKFNEYRNDTSETYKSDFDSRQLYDFVNDSNIFTFFHTRQYTDSPYYNFPNITLYETYGINWNYYDFALKNISDQTIQNTFIQDYEEYFRISGHKTISDFFEKNASSYDPTKKNVIWIGDSLILDDTYIYPEKTNEMQGILRSWLKLFPSSEYNFLFKPHPSYWLERSENYIKWLTGSTDDSNFVYFDTFPWEVFLSWNYKMQKTDSSYVGLFAQNSNLSIDNVFVGFQFTSTTLQTTAFFLQDQYGYSLDQVEATLNPYYFPIPETFDEVLRTTSFSVKPADQVQINKDRISQIYQPFVENNTYPDYTRDLIVATDFIREVYNPDYTINSSTSNINNNPSGLSQSEIIAISVVIPLVVVITISTVIALKIRDKKKKNIKTV